MENLLMKADIRRFAYDNESKLENIQLNIQKGECLVLTGLSGCGKTTLLRCLNGLNPDFYEGTMDGEVRFQGKKLSQFGKGELAKHMGNVFQNPKDQFFSTVAEDEIALVGENMGMEREKLKRKVDRAMESMGIEHLKKKSVFEMSGGERQKVAIASTLVYDTDIIFFDEPSASLDYQATEELKQNIHKLKAMGKTVVIAEHRLYYLKDLWDRLVIMKNKTIHRIYSREELTEDIRKANDLRCFDENSLRASMGPPPKEGGIQVNQLQVAIHKQVLLPPINFQLAKGECMAVIGMNGVGKTTLGKELAGLLPVPFGSTDYGKSKRQRLKKSYYVLQDADSQIFAPSVEKELIPKEKVQDENYLKQVAKLLKDSDLWEKRMEHPQELSSGEKQRLALLTALIEEHMPVILDEPTAGLDYKRMDMVAKLIEEKGKNIPILLITHDAELIFKIAHTALLLSKEKTEKIIVQGNEQRILSHMRGK